MLFDRGTMMRLNQFMLSGFCPRRQADVLIKAQQVRVNGDINARSRHRRRDCVEVGGERGGERKHDLYHAQ